MKDSLVKDRLVCGITDNVTRERLLREEDLTLEKAVKICKAAELVRERSKELSATAAATVHAVRPTKKPNQRSWGAKKQTSTKQHTGNERSGDASGKKQGQTEERARKHHCRRCDTWHVSGQCPAWGQICGRCKGKNHYAKCCLTRPSRVDTVTDDQEDTEGFDLDSVSVTVDSVKAERDDWICPLLVNGSIVPVKLDTGHR